jgi:hypothetical protein
VGRLQDIEGVMEVVVLILLVVYGSDRNEKWAQLVCAAVMRTWAERRIKEISDRE